MLGLLARFHQSPKVSALADAVSDRFDLDAITASSLRPLLGRRANRGGQAEEARLAQLGLIDACGSLPVLASTERPQGWRPPARQACASLIGVERLRSFGGTA